MNFQIQTSRLEQKAKEKDGLIPESFENVLFRSTATHWCTGMLNTDIKMEKFQTMYVEKIGRRIWYLNIH